LADFSNFWRVTLKRNLTQMSMVLATSPKCCRYALLWKAEVIVLSLTTVNSYWVVHASA